MLGNIAKRWQEINGNNNWEGLLEPLDIDLRRNIIIYGELTQAVYDSFVREKKSKYAGACRYNRKNLLKRATLSASQEKMYHITKYIYATSSISLPDSFLLKSLSRELWSMESNWIGFVGVSSAEGMASLGRRDVVVVWRGTVQLLEWFNDLDFSLVPAHTIFGPRLDSDEVLVHRGWLSLYTSVDSKSTYNNKMSARDQVLTEVGRLVDLYSTETTSITIVGHSLGAALSTLNAIDIVENGFNRSNSSPKMTSPVTAIVFASPRVGNSTFKKVFTESQDLKLLRIKNLLDLVPKYPSIGYEDVGTELLIDTVKSEFLKRPGNFSTWHNLECYLHGVAGTKGIDPSFEFLVDRDFSLVNKSTNALKDEFLVPEFWFVEKNHGMVQGSDGRWTLVDHEVDDDDDISQ